MPKRYYAVARGKTTGVFQTWGECQKQVHGFSGALHKGFGTLDQAQAWLLSEHKGPQSFNIQKISKRYYAVARGRTTGVFHSWRQCREQVHEFAGALHKGFGRIDQAQAWLSEHTPLVSPTMREEAKGADRKKPGRTEQVAQWAEKAAADPSEIIDDKAKPECDVLRGRTERVLEWAERGVIDLTGCDQKPALDVGRSTRQPDGYETPIANPNSKKRRLNVTPYATQGRGGYCTSSPQPNKMNVTPMDRKAATATPTSKFTGPNPTKEGEKFTATLLNVSVKEYIESGASEREGEELWRDICRKLAIPVSKFKYPVEASYIDPKTHMTIRKSLVVEEARESIATALHQRWRRAETETVPSSQDNSPGTMHFLFDCIGFGKPQPTETVLITLCRPFPDALSQKPD